ncbi:MAG: tetratricopeptide repeat protein [Nitrospiraceae bacterium]
MKAVTLLTLCCAVLWFTGCAKEPPKPKPRAPLPLGMSASTVAVQATEEGTRAFQARQFDEAKAAFEKAMAAAPDSGEAHYNLGLALFSMGDNDAAREHFIEAANLAPGNKVIWDSPALRQYGNPDSNIPKKKAPEYQGKKGGMGTSPR